MNSRIRNILGLALCLTVMGTLSCFPQTKEISNQQLLELKVKGNLQLIDVRTPEEVAEGTIDGAQNIDFRDPKFKQQIATLDKTKPIAVYCGAGGRSGKTSQLLEELGFQEIYDLTGGFTQWEAENFPVVK
ncbi:MAG: hypothetical protein DHS20C17_32470 [Cyclobacteriaceae bacterium]|nr:MAG: hypothetical protein DHS20C17_32470 [Cyclobacteriaceae bacterium]